VSIRQRPASVEDRAVPGHRCRQGMQSMPERGEGDLIGGSRNSYIATLVERHTRYVMLAKVPNKDTQSVVSALIKQADKLPCELSKSLTWDRGKELSDHRRFTLATDIDVYFCDPSSPWQRGSNENTNRLLRQYFPKGIDLSVHSQAHLNKIARQLNERSRKTLPLSDIGKAIPGRTLLPDAERVFNFGMHSVTRKVLDDARHTSSKCFSSDCIDIYGFSLTLELYLAKRLR